MDLSFLPAVNAALNATATALLCLGRWRIARGEIDSHRRTMLAAFGVSTVFLALNARRGPLADRDLRLALRDRLAADELVRETVGHQGVQARSLIPPGLLGYEEKRREGPPRGVPTPKKMSTFLRSRRST